MNSLSTKITILDLAKRLHYENRNDAIPALLSLLDKDDINNNNIEIYPFLVDFRYIDLSNQ